MELQKFWLQNHLKIVGIFLCGFALCSSFSISLTQVFLVLSIIAALIDLFFYRKISKSISSTSLTKQEENYIQYFSHYRMLTIFYYFIAWIILRTLHIFLSDDPLVELFYYREIWLILIVPLIVFHLEQKVWFKYFILCLVLGCASTGAYNLYQHFSLDLQLGSYRVGGFKNTNNPLTYTGITGVTFFIVLGSVFYFFAEKKRQFAILISGLLLFVFAGFILSQSRSGYIALIPAIIFFFACFFRKKFIFVFPILLILFAYVYSKVPAFELVFQNGKRELLLNIQQNQLCGSFWNRIHLWEAGISMWIENPVIGTGNADYPKEHKKHMSPKACTVAAQPTAHMHNDYLNILVLFGSIGFSIYILFYFLPIFSLWSNRNLDSKISSRWLLIGSVSSIVMMFFMGMFQAHFTDEEVQMLFWVAVAIFYKYNKLS